MCDTRLPFTECTPTAHHGRRFDIGASLPDLSPGPHLVPSCCVPSVPSYTPSRSILPAYDPHCTLTRTSATGQQTLPIPRDIHQNRRTRAMTKSVTMTPRTYAPQSRRYESSLSPSSSSSSSRASERATRGSRANLCKTNMAGVSKIRR